jgi:hypothetical protein
VHKRGIRSLRELTGSHLPLLRTVLKEGKSAIREKFGLPHSKIRLARIISIFCLNLVKKITNVDIYQ